MSERLSKGVPFYNDNTDSGTKHTAPKWTLFRPKIRNKKSQRYKHNDIADYVYNCLPNQIWSCETDCPPIS